MDMGEPAMPQAEGEASPSGSIAGAQDPGASPGEEGAGIAHASGAGTEARSPTGELSRSWAVGRFSGLTCSMDTSRSRKRVVRLGRRGTRPWRSEEHPVGGSPFPLASSYRATPREKTSTHAPSTVPPNCSGFSCSGARYREHGTNALTRVS